MNIKPYEHLVQYYETDQMGIVHHSNYIRWFEEARSDLLTQAGLGYKEMEEMGIVIPVIGVTAEYKSMTRYYEKVIIETKVESYKGVRMKLSYIVKDKETGEIRCTGTSEHALLNASGRPLILKKTYPEVHKLMQLLSGEEE